MQCDAVPTGGLMQGRRALRMLRLARSMTRESAPPAKLGSRIAGLLLQIASIMDSRVPQAARVAASQVTPYHSSRGSWRHKAVRA